MNEIWIVIMIGGGVAIVLQVLKVFGVPLAGKQTIVRLIVVAAALVLAYLALQDQAELAVQDVLAYAAGIIVAAEGVYKWLIQQIAKPAP